MISPLTSYRISYRPEQRWRQWCHTNVINPSSGENEQEGRCSADHLWSALTAERRGRRAQSVWCLWRCGQWLPLQCFDLWRLQGLLQVNLWVFQSGFEQYRSPGFLKIFPKCYYWLRHFIDSDKGPERCIWPKIHLLFTEASSWMVSVEGWMWRSILPTK